MIQITNSVHFVSQLNEAERKLQEEIAAVERDERLLSESESFIAALKLPDNPFVSIAPFSDKASLHRRQQEMQGIHMSHHMTA